MDIHKQEVKYRRLQDYKQMNRMENGRLKVSMKNQKSQKQRKREQAGRFHRIHLPHECRNPH